MKVIAALVAASALWVALVAQAAPTLITSNGDPALNGSTTIDFEAAPLGPFTSQSIGGVNFSAGGGTLYIENDFSGFFGSTGQYFANQDTLDPITMAFGAGGVTAFGFSWGAADQPWTLDLFDLGNTLIGSLAIPAQTDPYIGFIGADGNGMVIGSARLTMNLVNQPYDYFLLDDLEFVAAATVPEPVGLALIGLVLMLLASVCRRHRR